MPHRPDRDTKNMPYKHAEKQSINMTRGGAYRLKTGNHGCGGDFRIGIQEGQRGKEGQGMPKMPAAGAIAIHPLKTIISISLVA